MFEDIESAIDSMKKGLNGSAVSLRDSSNALQSAIEGFCFKEEDVVSFSEIDKVNFNNKIDLLQNTIDDLSRQLVAKNKIIKEFPEYINERKNS